MLHAGSPGSGTGPAGPPMRLPAALHQHRPCLRGDVNADSSDDRLQSDAEYTRQPGTKDVHAMKGTTLVCAKTYVWLTRHQQPCISMLRTAYGQCVKQPLQHRAPSASRSSTFSSIVSTCTMLLSPSTCKQSTQCCRHNPRCNSHATQQTHITAPSHESKPVTTHYYSACKTF